MNTEFTITIAGHDRPNLMNQLAATTHSLGGKWLVSKLNRLDNQIAGIIRIDVPNQSAVQLKAALSEITECHVRIIDDLEPLSSSVQKVSLSVESQDRPGLVHDLTQRLDDLGVHTLAMENTRIGVPDAGKTVFMANLDVEVPVEMEIEQLLNSVETIDPNLKAHCSV
ncbi:glycine cleavage system protein R [Thaumasiovibrio subtropicus]|uniref:glycine cleavage system protein R n=1 Tax=Thaumasiovibrio subtropicus TaxID=1891207 RepID=UPI000B34AA20|nr:ACT domain-containing protein [Thaumasiovibrio subtropicus]